MKIGRQDFNVSRLQRMSDSETKGIPSVKLSPLTGINKERRNQL